MFQNVIWASTPTHTPLARYHTLDSMPWDQSWPIAQPQHYIPRSHEALHPKVSLRPWAVGSAVQNHSKSTDLGRPINFYKQGHIYKRG